MEQLILIPFPIDKFRELLSDVLDQKLKLIYELNEAKSSGEENDPLLNPAEAAKLARVCKATLRAWENRDIITGHRVGRKVYYVQSELIDAIKGR